MLSFANIDDIGVVATFSSENIEIYKAYNQTCGDINKTWEEASSPLERSIARSEWEECLVATHKSEIGLIKFQFQAFTYGFKRLVTGAWMPEFGYQ